MSRGYEEISLSYKRFAKISVYNLENIFLLIKFSIAFFIVTCIQCKKPAAMHGSTLAALAAKHHHLLDLSQKKPITKSKLAQQAEMPPLQPGVQPGNWPYEHPTLDASLISIRFKHPSLSIRSMDAR